MRISYLEMTAFGPFAGHEVVDFDELTSAGLFLLCGPTGAGKTSVLDAICFGLYGEVPGDRNSAKRLRSDHAEAGVAPAVVLEVSINARRFRISRSPAWQRPKRRGEGTVLEHPKVNLEELVDGVWLHLSNRLDETGHMMTELLGMNVTQFCQVALLPQGRFQSFLRAKSDERHKVLQQLFRTGRFEGIERWLVAHRRTLKDANRAHQEAVASVVSRISEAAGDEVPETWDLHDLAGPAGAGGVASWASDLETFSSAAHQHAELELRSATDRAEIARSQLSQATRVLDLLSRHAEATQIEQSLRESAHDEEDADLRLDAARRAASVAPLLKVADRAQCSADTAESSLGEVLADAAGRLGADALALSHDDLTAAERQARDAATTARALLPRETELRTGRQTLAATSQALSEKAVVAATLLEREEAIPLEVVPLRQECPDQAAVAAELSTLDSMEPTLLGQLKAAEKLAALNQQLESVREQHQVSVDTAQFLRERLHDIREARINGMAAELAAVLTVGDSCPVCGSADHPSIALASAGAPTNVDEELARTAYDDADFARQTHDEVLRSLQHNRALAAQAAGNKTVHTLEDELSVVRQRRVTCEDAETERARLTNKIDALTGELTDVRRRAGEVTVEVARLGEQRDLARDVVDKVSAELAVIFADDEVVGSIGQLIDAKSAAGMAFAQARDALAARDAAVLQARECSQQAMDCAAEHGFGDSVAAAQAWLAPEQVGSLEELLHARASLRVKAASVLDDAEIQAAFAVPMPDLIELKSTVTVTDDAMSALGAQMQVLANRANRLSKLKGELCAELDAWAPTRSAYSVAHTVSTFVEGKGGDNALQMRLSAYVLAARLQQVVAAANERLSTMSDQRYTLEHSSSRGVGELRGGLSLQVRDEWTGESRDPATLSGGETFVASLALALGLADVVTQEAGGSNIDTLFIDEGFGTLDQETLDDVMDTLDGLRDGGRVVGIVSHVPEMRTRVPAQLQILKQRSGSRVVARRETA